MIEMRHRTQRGYQLLSTVEDIDVIEPPLMFHPNKKVIRKGVRKPKSAAGNFFPAICHTTFMSFNNIRSSILFLLFLIWSSISWVDRVWISVGSIKI